MLTTGEGISKSQKLNDTIHDKASTYILYVYINFCDLLMSYPMMYVLSSQ